MNNTIGAGIFALPGFCQLKPAWPRLKRFPISTLPDISTRHTLAEGIKTRRKDCTILIFVVG